MVDIAKDDGTAVGTTIRPTRGGGVRR